MQEQNNIFLFSIDLEDVRRLMPNMDMFAERVPQMIHQYLKFLKSHNAQCTFFTVGDQLRAYPDLIRNIIDNGHEIACHTNTHIPLTQQTPTSFENDIEQFLESAYQLGVRNIIGFRAPVFSLTENTKWAYPILKKFGFTYSSSVLPAKNPLYGWEEFGNDFKLVDDIFEMPITVHPLLKVPLAGGVYFRVIPFFILKNAIKNLFRQGLPLQNYLHPYDIDIDQERFMHPGIKNNKLFNYLMYKNRDTVFQKIEKIMDMGVSIMPYKDCYVEFKAQNTI
jgi:polysaccharide deacetylase family protein (PEP-CTERM system associated)